MLAAIDALTASPRMKLAVVAVLAVNVMATVGWVASVHGLMDGFHQPFGGDFIIFYATSKLTLAGHGVQAFDPATLLAAERTVIPAVQAGLKWCYPPPFQLLVAPLALVPFVPAYLLFIGATAVPYLLLVRRIAGTSPWVLVAAMAFVGTFTNAWQGQNGFLTTALLGWGLLLVERRPWLGGALLGLLIYKPQFGLLLPVLLVGTGNWPAVAGAAGTACGFAGLSTLAFGVEGWRAFFQTLPEVSRTLADGSLPWSKIPSVLVGLRSVGVPAPLASAVQLMVAAGVAGVTLACWRRSGPPALKMAVTMTAAFLVSPYSFNYDLVLLAAPIAAVAVHMRARATPTGTGAVLMLAALLPSLSVQIAKTTHVQPCALALLLCFAMFARVSWAAGGRKTPSVARSLLSAPAGLPDAA